MYVEIQEIREELDEKRDQLLEAQKYGTELIELIEDIIDLENLLDEMLENEAD